MLSKEKYFEIVKKFTDEILSDFDALNSGDILSLVDFLAEVIENFGELATLGIVIASLKEQNEEEL